MLAPVAERTAAPAAPAASRIFALLNRLLARVSAGRRERRLRLCEMLPLGEKRFIAVIEYGADKFLLAGTTQSISLLQRLERQGLQEARDPEAGHE